MEVRVPFFWDKKLRISTFRPKVLPSSSRDGRSRRTKCRKVVEDGLTLEDECTRFSSKFGIRLPTDTASHSSRILSHSMRKP